MRTRVERAFGALAATGALALPLVLAPTLGAAAPAPTAPRAEVVQALSDCRKIAENAARLACYDKAAGALDQAESQGSVVVIDQAQVATVRRQAFGFRMPSLTFFAKAAPKSGEGVDHLTLVVASARLDGSGRWTFVAEDGAVWRQTEDGEFASEPHKGSALLVKNGVLGSFFCKLDGQPQVRCMRVN
jgi:hypothetical protein